MNRIGLLLKRVVCFAIILSMMVNTIAQYTLPVLSYDFDAYITLDGARVDEIFVADGEKITVTAICDEESNFNYRWQIKHPQSDDTWINISRQTSSDIAVSNSLVESLADDNHISYIRCVVKGDNEYITNVLAVHLIGCVPDDSFEDVEVEDEIFEEETPTEEEEIPTEEEEIPTEEEEEPTEEEEIPTEEEETPTEEEEIPTEEEETPTEEEEEPTEEEEIPTEEEEIPTEEEETPTEEEETPTEEEEIPTEEEETPTEEEETPTEEEEIPTEEEETPTEEEEIPTEEEETPTEEEEVPTEEEEIPTEEEETPTEEEEVPTEEEEIPTEEEEIPTEEEETPTEEEEIPIEEETVGVETKDNLDSVSMIVRRPFARIAFPSQENAVTLAEEQTSNKDVQNLTEDDDKEFVNFSIVINYLFDNNTIAFEPYGATVANGSSFIESVKSPTVVGYDPYRRVDGEYVDASTVNFDIDSVTEDIVVNVIYRPALVEFSIHHHLQNLHNDEYSLSYDYITTSYALTGSLVPDGLAFTEAQLPGFKALSYEKLDVAADGSTVVEIRYDRNYYLVDFDMNGGYGTEPIYTRFGDIVGANSPIRHGYVFQGWELVSYGGHTPTEAQRSEFAIREGTTITVPAANLRYKARWSTTQTTYTMVFWKENANDNGYSYWGQLEGLGALSGTLVNGLDLISQVDGIDDEEYFTFNENKTEKGVLVEGDGSTVVNVYYTRSHYKLMIKATGACTIEPKHTHGEGCYDYICGYTHIHTDECVAYLNCEIPVHLEHTDDCLICTLEEHVHNYDCSCKIEAHTHNKNCWSGVGAQQNNAPNGAPANPEDGYIYKRSYSNVKYIYIQGTWYRYTGIATSGVIVDRSCGKNEHTHTELCSCPITAHSHGIDCYSDFIHAHDDNCYLYSCGNKSHEHSDSCNRLICSITENHTHSSTCTRATSTNVVKEIYKKYGESIENIWPIVDDNGVVYDNGERWSPSDSSFYDQVLVHITTMPPDSFTLTLNQASHVPYTMQYYLEVLPDSELPEGAETVTYKNRVYMLSTVIKAKYNYVTKAEDFFDIVGFEQYESSPAFSGNQISISGDESKKVVKFYYNRITDHYLDFSNNGEVLDDKEQYGIMYGASLEEYNFVPEYPSKLEPGAYTFGGWYTSSGCFDGTEVDWQTLTMPEGDLLLYAKWAPNKHKVNVWLDSSLTQKVAEEQIVDHGAFAIEPSGSITNGNYIFQGWFYKDVVNGEVKEKAFVFSGITVVDDLDIYAKWGSHVSVDYKVKYLLYGTDEPVADPTEGSAIAGYNKTFDAKAGSDLYAPYQSGYYPMVNSHTIVMSVDGTHEFTFYYTYAPSMPYAVRYVDAETGERLCPDKIVMDNTLSVVTEIYTKFDNTMPDAYQKRLVLSADDTDSDEDGIFDKNIITFYYSYDEIHAYYKVVHYIHNISTNGYREYRSVETVGIIGETYTVDALSMAGFYFNRALTAIDGVVTPVEENSVTATLSDDGMLIELYYDRYSYNYSVVYKNGETGEEIYPRKQDTALFGDKIIETAVDLRDRGYVLSSDEVKAIDISTNDIRNVIEFIYLESVSSIKYQIVGPHGCGSLSRSSENVLAISGMPQGSVPLSSKGYRFVGWYTDADCTIEADSSIVDAETFKLTPIKASDEIWPSSVEFFALFVPNETKLTVIKSGHEPFDTEQAFIFRLRGIENTTTEEIDLTFVIMENGYSVIAGLPVGEYIVTEQADWSWRYTPDEIEKRITLAIDEDANTVIFSNSRTRDKWLDGNSYIRNVFD